MTRTLKAALLSTTTIGSTLVYCISNIVNQPTTNVTQNYNNSISFYAKQIVVLDVKHIV